MKRNREITSEEIKQELNKFNFWVGPIEDIEDIRINFLNKLKNETPKQVKQRSRSRCKKDTSDMHETGRCYEDTVSSENYAYQYWVCENCGRVRTRVYNKPIKFFIGNGALPVEEYYLSMSKSTKVRKLLAKHNIQKTTTIDRRFG